MSVPYERRSRNSAPNRGLAADDGPLLALDVDDVALESIHWREATPKIAAALGF